MGSIKRI